MDIKPGQIYENSLGPIWVLAVVNHWAMVSRGEGFKPGVMTTAALRDTCTRVAVSPFIQADSRRSTTGDTF